MILFVVGVVASLAAAPAVAAGPAPSASGCPAVSWVGFTPTVPYDPAVAAVAAPLWLTSLAFPCPSVAWGVGVASLQGPLPIDAAAGQVACAHSVGIAVCGPALALTVIGLPLVMLETMWIAPVSVLNAMDRDVKCARARQQGPSPSPSVPPSPPVPAAPRGPPSLPSPSPPSTAPGASRSDPLPLPLPLPPATTSPTDAPAPAWIDRPMAW